jgi:long-chain acyl-CoA synthetase
MGRLDADDFLYIVERKKDLIIRGGFNIYPRDVEEALYAFPKAAEAAVIGMSDALMGEEVLAVVPGSAVRAVGRSSLCQARRAGHARKRSASWMPAKEPGGKILRKSSGARSAHNRRGMRNV